jgi:uracil-DNA glycosylase
LKIEDYLAEIDPAWFSAVPQFTDGTLAQLVQKVHQLRQSQTIYPPETQLLRAFSLVPFPAVRVVILGQDPYHTPGKADGLAFSVPADQRIPPSLRNVFKEIRRDVYAGEDTIEFSSDLTRWAKQGILLLNTVLTVTRGAAKSHRKLGWQSFTSAVLRGLNSHRSGLVFLLWGNDARRQKKLLAGEKHLILEAPHPSPLARGGFFGCRHFSQTNAFLNQQLGQAPINW